MVFSDGCLLRTVGCSLSVDVFLAKGILTPARARRDLFATPVSMRLMTFSSPMRGSLPPEGPLSLCGVDLPAGVHLRPGAGLGDVDVPCAWVTAAPVPAESLAVLVQGLAAGFESTGLWPIAMVGFEPSLGRLSMDGQLMGRDEDSDFDVEAFLLSPDEPGDPAYAGYLASLAPINEVTALGGPVQAEAARADQLVIPWGADEGVCLALVPATSPADTLASLGWMGPANYGLEGAGIARIVASWEERYHLTVTGLGFDLLALQFPADGLAHDDLVTLLAEVHRACPDSYDQGGFADVASYIVQMAQGVGCVLWWD